ncbi:hypothetical protein PUN28_007321 [Cardiocondyla obscurior]|uniref:Uncharacterized protein n=1 Tax=Cardiocondyla obscurior TaxID=286306 RepID=A0AAW2G8J7_9HYME
MQQKRRRRTAAERKPRVRRTIHVCAIKYYTSHRAMLPAKITVIFTTAVIRTKVFGPFQLWVEKSAAGRSFVFPLSVHFVLLRRQRE